MLSVDGIQVFIQDACLQEKLWGFRNFRKNAEFQKFDDDNDVGVGAGDYQELNPFVAGPRKKGIFEP